MTVRARLGRVIREPIPAGRSVIAVRTEEPSDRVAGELQVPCRLFHAGAGLACRREKQNAFLRNLGMAAKDGQERRVAGPGRTDKH